LQHLGWDNDDNDDDKNDNDENDDDDNPFCCQPINPLELQVDIVQLAEVICHCNI